MWMLLEQVQLLEIWYLLVTKVGRETQVLKVTKRLFNNCNISGYLQYNMYYHHISFLHAKTTWNIGSDTQNSILTLHNINGKKIAATTVKEDKIKCLIFSSRTEGRNINVIAAGLKSGTIRSDNFKFIKV